MIEFYKTVQIKEVVNNFLLLGDKEFVATSKKIEASQTIDAVKTVWDNFTKLLPLFGFEKSVVDEKIKQVKRYLAKKIFSLLNAKIGNFKVIESKADKVKAICNIADDLNWFKSETGSNFLRDLSEQIIEVEKPLIDSELKLFENEQALILKETLSVENYIKKIEENIKKYNWVLAQTNSELRLGYTRSERMNEFREKIAIYKNLNDKLNELLPFDDTQKDVGTNKSIATYNKKI